MLIGIDVSAVVYGTGVSVYTINLVENLLQLGGNEEYFLFGGSLRRAKEIEAFFRSLKAHSFKSKILPIPPTMADLIWNRIHTLSIEKIIGEIDVFHSSDWTQPPSKAFKVTTIHDLTPILFPKLAHNRIVSAHNRRLKWVVKEVDRVIVPSETTAKDAEKLGVKRDKIRIIPEALDSTFKPVNKSLIERIKSKYGITGGFLLAVGVNERKNTRRIIEAYQKIKDETKLNLIIVGHQYSNFEKTEGVVFTGHVSSSELPALYSGAEALVYPSLYEGFGLPILEGFATEIAVVTSNIGSMAEVAGGAAVLVDPVSTESVAFGILDALRNREKYIRLGRKRLEHFTWEKTAKATLDVYKEAM